MRNLLAAAVSMALLASCVATDMQATRRAAEPSKSPPPSWSWADQPAPAPAQPPPLWVEQPWILEPPPAPPPAQ
jgi:hypothetical protein